MSEEETTSIAEEIEWANVQFGALSDSQKLTGVNVLLFNISMQLDLLIKKIELQSVREKPTEENKGE